MSEILYVERNKNGKIISAFRAHQGRELEMIAEDHPEVVEFRKVILNPPSNIPQSKDGGPVRV
jgi:hypothetical protein